MLVHLSEGGEIFVNVIEHYDKLIDENNDPVYDPESLQKYMNKNLKKKI